MPGHCALSPHLPKPLSISEFLAPLMPLGVLIPAPGHCRQKHDFLGIPVFLLRTRGFVSVSESSTSCQVLFQLPWDLSVSVCVSVSFTGSLPPSSRPHLAGGVRRKVLVEATISHPSYPVLFGWTLCARGVPALGADTLGSSLQRCQPWGLSGSL